MADDPGHYLMRTNPMTGDKEEFALINIVGMTASGRSFPCPVDPKTGIIKVPNAYLWSSVMSKTDEDNFKNALVRSFGVTISHEKGSGIVVMQRKGRTKTYERPRHSHLEGESLVEVSLPVTMIEGWQRLGRDLAQRLDYGPMAVYTLPMNRENSNRIDMWLIDADGSISLWCSYIFTLDDGRTFRHTVRKRWSGKYYLRQPGVAYDPTHNADPRFQKLYKDDVEVRKMLETYVFVPDIGYENFSSRAEALVHQDFRDLVKRVNPGTFTGPEKFWVEAPPARKLKAKEGWVKFLTLGHGRGAMGIGYFAKPFKFKGSDVEHLAFQFEMHGIDNGDEFEDEQGLVIPPPGTVVKIDYDRLVDMGVNEENGKPYPPFAPSLEIMMVPKY